MTRFKFNRPNEDVDRMKAVYIIASFDSLPIPLRYWPPWMFYQSMLKHETKEETLERMRKLYEPRDRE